MDAISHVIVSNSQKNERVICQKRLIGLFRLIETINLSVIN